MLYIPICRNRDFCNSMKSIKRFIFEFFFITSGCFLLAVSINVFLLPNNISAGGISSVGVILFHLFKIRISITNLIFNAVLFFFGYKNLGRHAVVKTALGTVLLSLFLELSSGFPVYKENQIIAAISGGILMGVGVGLVVKVDASTGGSDFAGLILKKFFGHIPLARLIMIIDCAVVILSGVVFKSFTITFYSVMTLFVSSLITDKLITAGDEAKMIMIISQKKDEIAEQILVKYERGITGIHSVGMYSNSETIMLMCIVAPKELPKYLKMIKEIDKKAFIIIGNVNEVIGEGFKQIS
mgnify:FL=1